MSDTTTAVTGSAPEKSGNTAAGAVPGGVANRSSKSVLDLAMEETAKLRAAQPAPVKQEDGEKPLEATESDDAAAEADPSEEEVEVKPNDPEGFKKRVDKLNEKVKAAQGEAQKYQVEVAKLDELLKAEQGKVAQYEHERKVVEDFQLVSRIDPQLKALMENHWFFKGRAPTLEDFDNDQAAFQQMLGIIAEKRAEVEMSSREARANTDKEIDARIASYEKEESSLKKHAVFGQFMNDKDLTTMYNFVAEQERKGNQYFDSLEKVVPVLFRDRYEKQLRKVGAEEAVSTIDRSKRAGSLKPRGAAAPSAPPDFSKMTSLQKAHYYTSQLQGA